MVKGEVLTFTDCHCSFLMMATHTTAVFFTRGRVIWVNSAQQDASFSGTLFILVLLSLLPGFFLEILFHIDSKTFRIQLYLLLIKFKIVPKRSRGDNFVDWFHKINETLRSPFYRRM
jgi:hypothetical protein